MKINTRLSSTIVVALLLNVSLANASHRQMDSSDQIIELAQAQGVPAADDLLREIINGSSEPSDMSSLEDVWRELEINSQIWPLIMDDEPKRLTVVRYINHYAQLGIQIRKPAMHYVQMIDAVSVQNPAILQNPFVDLIKLMAIIEYDFDNGYDPDSMAKQVLGEKWYNENKNRLKEK